MFLIPTLTGIPLIGAVLIYLIHNEKIRGLIIYIIALCLIAWLSFYIFSVLDYQYAKILSKVFILVGLGYVVFEYIKHKDEIIKKLNRLHG